MEPRALLVPPGFPDFMSRRRVVRPGPVLLEGRAWSGWAPIATVEVSTDGGTTWTGADVQPAAETHAGARWTWTWHARAGTYELSSRASDASGRREPLDQSLNRGGCVNNAVQRVDVLVTE